MSRERSVATAANPDRRSEDRALVAAAPPMTSFSARSREHFDHVVAARRRHPFKVRRTLVRVLDYSTPHCSWSHPTTRRSRRRRHRRRGRRSVQRPRSNARGHGPAWHRRGRRRFVEVRKRRADGSEHHSDVISCRPRQGTGGPSPYRDPLGWRDSTWRSTTRSALDSARERRHTGAKVAFIRGRRGASSVTSALFSQRLARNAAQLVAPRGPHVTSARTPLYEGPARGIARAARRASAV